MGNSGARSQGFASRWADGLVAWIDRLPGPAWLFYVIVLALLILTNHAVLWIDGAVSPGSFAPDPAMYALYILYWFALYHYLNRFASRSLARFRPLLDADEAEIRLIDRRLVTLPRSLGLLSVLLGVGLAFVSWDLRAPVGPAAARVKTALPVVYYFSGMAFLAVSFFATFFRTIRQLLLVDHLHKRAGIIDLLDLDAPHAFSSMTARAGLGLVLLLLLISLPDPGYPFEAPPGPAGVASYGPGPVEIVSYALIAVLAAAVFVLPLSSMHARLAEAKRNALGRTNRLLRAEIDRLHTRVEANDHKGFEETNEAIGAPRRERELFGKISTWPWGSGTIRGFASTLLLPVFLLLIARLLERIP